MSENSSATATSTGSNNKNKAPKLKIIVRNLQSSMKEETFLSYTPVTNVFKENKVDWYYFSKGSEGHFPASAYFHFTKQEDLFDFSEQFNAFLNEEKSLQLTPAIQIEYAPYQKTSSTLSASQNSLLRNTKQVADPRQGTIETDEDYLAFLKDLTKPVEKSMSADRRLELQEEKEREQGKEIKTTPLLEALKEKKLKKEKRKEKFSNKHKAAPATAAAEKETAASNSGSQHQGGGHHGKQRVRYVEVSNEEPKATNNAASTTTANSTSTQQQPQENSNYDGGYKKNYYGGRGGRGGGGRGGNRGGGRGGSGSGSGGRGGRGGRGGGY